VDFVPDIEVWRPKIKGQAILDRPLALFDDASWRPFDINSNFTVTTGFACQDAAMGEPFVCWKSFETDTGF
jgi:hypothetical protein